MVQCYVDENTRFFKGSATNLPEEEGLEIVNFSMPHLEMGEYGKLKYHRLEGDCRENYVWILDEAGYNALQEEPEPTTEEKILSLSAQVSIIDETLALVIKEYD